MKYKIPKIKNPKPLTMAQRMKAYCLIARAEINNDSGCKDMRCSECLFSYHNITSLQKEQFLEWERMIKQTGEQ